MLPRQSLATNAKLAHLITTLEQQRLGCEKSLSTTTSPSAPTILQDVHFLHYMHGLDYALELAHSLHDVLLRLDKANAHVQVIVTACAEPS